jgi:hypothetical protein
MSVPAVHGSPQSAQAEAVSQAQATQKQTSQHGAVSHDKVTISAAAQAKQTASAIGADSNHKSK